MMRAIAPRLMRLFLLGIWFTTAGTIRAEDCAPSPSPASPPAQAAEADQEKSSSPAETAPNRQSPSIVKPPARSPTAPAPRKNFRPSEEIHVDKAVDFPADI